MRSKRRTNHMFLLWAVVPTAVLLIVFLVIPTLQSVILSFQEVNLLSTGNKFVAFDNFIYLVKDPIFIRSLFNTLKLMVAIPAITLSISFLLAFLLQQVKLRETSLYITFSFYPYFMSATVVAIVWSFVLHPTSGILNKMLEMIGLGALQRPWVGDSSTALWCIAAVIIWASIGYYIVLYTSGLESISPELYESATLDGAGFFQKLVHITLPLMKNIIGITFVLLMAGALNASFVYSKLLTNGGPNGASNVLMKYIYDQGIKSGNMGYASAISTVTIIIGVVLSALSRKMTGKSVKE